jgi:hypothetical protein
MAHVATSDPLSHTANIGAELDALIQHLREDIGKVEEPRAQVLFETTAEVLKGLRTTYDHYEQGQEEPFRR